MIGLRKLIAFMVGMVINGGLAYYKAIDAGVYSVVSVALITGFFTGNVLSKAQDKAQAKA